MNEWFSHYPEGLTYVVLAFVVLAEATFAAVRRSDLYGTNDTMTNVLMYIGHVAIDIWWLPIVFTIYSAVHDYSPFKLGEQWWTFSGYPVLITWIAIFLADDLTYYVFHRTSHKVRILWASHVNHHSSPRMNLSVGLRQTWTPFSSFIFWLPLCLIGFEPLMMLTMQGVSLFYQALLHTEIIRKLGPLELVLNTPSCHRVHHGTNSEYLDKNFGGILIIWDRVFGTFAKEHARPIYGINPALSPSLSLRTVFHEWHDIGADLLRARSWRDVFRATLWALALFVIIPANVGCASVFHTIQIERLWKHVTGLSSYEGMLVERGVTAAEPLVSNVIYLRPYHFLSVVQEPARFRGTAMLYEGQSLTLFYPRLAMALVFDGLPVLSEKDQRVLVKRRYMANVERFSYELKGDGKVAGHSVFGMDYKAHSASAFHQSGRVMTYDKYSMPLKGTLHFKTGASYSYEFQDLQFGIKPEAGTFDLPIAKNIAVIKWSLNGPGVDEKEMRQRANFPIALPKLAPGFVLQKILALDGPMPAFTLIYRDGPYFVAVTLQRAYGVAQEYLDYGIPVPTGGRLLISPVISTYSYANDKTQYAIAGNLPFDDLLDIRPQHSSLHD